MDFLNFHDVSFLQNSSFESLCEDFYNTVGQGVWYDMFQVNNIEWFWLVNDFVATMKSDKVSCGSFGLYPSYVAGILNTVKEIYFYVLCSEKLNDAEYIVKVLPVKCTVLLVKRIDEMNSGYHLVVRHLHFR